MKHLIVVLSSVSLLLATGCSGGSFGRSAAKPERGPEPVARDLQLEQRLARLELRLLEREAQVEELQARLDDARKEVVRGMAKTQSLATRAEAASGMAEADIALRSLRASRPAHEITEVGRLMSQSTAEFEKQNYGGALYLASQAKSAVLAARGQLASVAQETLRRGEVPFALPLRLQTSARANLREGPGNAFAIVFTLPAGTGLTVHSFADQWVRVTDDAGRRGWIYQSLIDRRP